MMIPVIDVIRDGVFLVFKKKCEYCKRNHVHGAGGYGTPSGFGNGHRSSHCDGYPEGYYIKEVEK